MNLFLGKVFIRGTIELITGLHVGGNRESGEIGGMDNPVIKDVRGVPYIPGSSLKGKLRCTLERAKGWKPARREEEPCGCGHCNICLIFGSHSDKNKDLTRLCVRDAWLDRNHFKEVFPQLYDDGLYTEEKTENIIDRIGGTAKHPRTMERVPAGSRFPFEVILNLFGDDRDRLDTLTVMLVEGLRMVEDEYLGGSGTRGYGKIQLRQITVSIKRPEEYQGDNQPVEILASDDLTFETEELIASLRREFSG